MIYPKFTVVGDAEVGKNLLLYSYATQRTDHAYVPDVFDLHFKKLLLDGIEYNVFLACTCGQENYEKLLPLSYQNTNCFILCYSIDDERSYRHIETKWAPDIKHNINNPLIILVGTKCDLRDGLREVLGKEDGEKMKDLIGAKKFLECSAKDLQSLNAVFDEALKLHVQYNVGTISKKPEGKCVVL